jgi:hypothetical protein
MRYNQGRRNRGGQAPQVLPSALFPGAKCPFLALKIVIKIAFFAQRAIFFVSGKNIIYPENFLVYRENFFHIYEKMWYIRKKFLK